MKSLISRAIPGLFGGVSQQIPAMRHSTQCEEQLNGLSTVVRGLFKRPGTKHVARLPFTWASGAPAGNVHAHVIDRGNGARWEVLLGTTGLSVVSLETGATEPVVYQDVDGNPASMPAYLSATNPATAYRTITVADTTFLVNSEKTVTSVNADAATFPANTAYVYVKLAVPQHSYSIFVNGTAASHATPATGVTVASITSALIAALNGIGGVSASGVAGVNGLIQLTHPANANILASDTYGNTTMVVLSNGVPRFADLPPSFPVGPRLTIVGSDAGASIDPYYVTWTGKQWKETRAYGVATGLNPATMPHRLFKDGSNWVVRPSPWEARLVGDDDTNPMPSFVGKVIRDIFFYRNRLGFLAGDSLVLSRSGKYFNFFSTTAVEVLESDPIDLGGAAESVESLDWAVPFNQQLIIWASTKQQFALESGDVLSPLSARLVPTTAYESVNTARPKQLGNRIVFPSTINGFTQMSLYRVSQDTVSNTAETVTDHVPTYIPVEPRSIELSETAKVLAVVPPGLGKDLYVFKYEDDGDKLTQRAWQKFTMAGGIVKAHWAGQLLYLTLLYENATPAGESVLCLEVVDFSDTAADPGLNFGMRLDRRMFVNGATEVAFGEYEFDVAMPNSSDLRVLRYTDGSTPVQLQVVSKTVTSGGLRFRVKAPSGTGRFVVGAPYSFRYVFTEVFMRDQEGVPVMDSRLKLLKMLVRYVDTGFFKAIVKTKALGVYEYFLNGQGVGLPGQLLGGTAPIVDGDFAIPVHAQAKGTEVVLESDSHLPCCFPYAEWRGNLVMKSQR